MPVHPEIRSLHSLRNKASKIIRTKRKQMVIGRDIPNEDMLFCPAVHVHLQLLQGAISRYSNFCMNCKMMCVAMISAYSFILSSSRAGLLIPFLIVFACFAANVRYLRYERAYKKKYNIFLELVKNESKSKSKHELFEMGVEIKEFSNVMHKIFVSLWKCVIINSFKHFNGEGKDTFKLAWEKHLRKEMKVTLADELSAYKDPPSIVVYLSSYVIYFIYYISVELDKVVVQSL